MQNHEEGKNPQEGSGTGPEPKAEKQGSEQIGGTSAESCLEQKTTDSPESGARTGTEIGPVTVSEPGSPNNQAEDRSVTRSWKHKKSHPLDQIFTDLNSGCKQDLGLRIFVLSMLFSLILNLRMFMKLL